MATLLPEGKQSFQSSAGVPLVGGKLYTYDAGTSTPRATYQDAAGTVPNTNPVILDARGEATIFWSGSYKVVLKDAADATIWTVDVVRDADYSVTVLTALLASVYGSANIGFLPAGANPATRTVQDKLRDRVAVVDQVGADLGVKITNAIAALPATGGIVDLQMLSGPQTIPSKVSITKANVTLLFGSATYTLSGVAATQAPFGAQFLVTAANVYLVGNYATKFVMAAGAQANAVTFLHGASLGGCVGIEMDGNKANNVGQVDDTFQSGIQIISSTGGGATVNSQITVLGCNIHDFIHYGIVTYGDLSNSNTIRDCLIYDNGKAGDAHSTGDGVYINKGSGLNLVTGVRAYGNKLNGIHISTAGTDQKNNKVIDNWCYSNGQHGIFPQEQANLGSVNGVGQTSLVLRGNHCYSNTQDGIRIGTYDNVGYLKNLSIDGNHCYSNAGYGILLQSNADAANNLRQTIVTNNQVYSNGLDGIGVAANVLDTTVTGNTSIGNAGSQIVDNGTRSLVFGNKDSITAPVWYETGTWIPADGSGAGLALTVAAATYVKIGKMVYATFAVTYPATANGATARVGGLPYTSQNAAAGMHPVPISFTTKAGLLAGVVDSNAKTFSFTSTAGTTLTNVDVSTAIIRGTAIYEVA